MKSLNSVKKEKNIFFRFLSENLGILAAFFVIGLIISLLSPVFLTADNMFSVGRQISTNATIALGMALVILLGGIDLSVGAVVALSGTVCVDLVNNGTNVLVAVLAGIFIGTFVGLVNGIIIAKTGMAPFIVTMASMNIVRGIAFIYSGGLPIRSMDDNKFAKIGTGYLGPIPLPIVYLVIFVIIVAIVLSRSKFGTYIYALGGNREAARFSGIPIKKIEILVYMISGFMSAFAGVVLASRMYSGQPSVASGAEMDAIAACVLGGVSMTGGVGKIGGVVIGSLIIGIISNGLNLVGINSFWQLVVKGIIVVCAVYFDIIKRKRINKGKTER